MGPDQASQCSVLIRYAKCINRPLCAKIGKALPARQAPKRRRPRFVALSELAFPAGSPYASRRGAGALELRL